MPLPKIDTTGLESFIPQGDIERILRETANPDPAPCPGDHPRNP